MGSIHLTEDLPCVEEEHLVFPRRLALAPIKEPERDRPQSALIAAHLGHFGN